MLAQSTLFCFFFCIHTAKRRFYWIDPFSYAQKAIAINEFDAPRWHAVTTAAGQPLGLTILDEKALPHERWWIW